MDRRQRYLAGGAAATILALWIAFAGDGLFAYFTPDDMMNLYGAWFQPLFRTDRPLGTLFYRATFALFGLDPMPYRVVCMSLVLLNVGLLYAFCVRLTESRAVGALGCLIGAYHAHLADLYYSTGTVYDLLCGAFYLGAFLYYARARAEGNLQWHRVAALLGLYGCALGAKEMAVTLPAILVLYDVLYRGNVWWRAIVPVGAVTAGFLYLKLFGAWRITANPAYTPHYTWDAFSQAWQHYVSELFYHAVQFTPAKLVMLWALLLAIAALLRRRALWFAFGFLMVAILPIAFIVPRGFFAIYLALPSWYLFAATTIEAVNARLPAVPRPAVFAALALLLVAFHRREKPVGMQWVAEAHATVRSALEHLHEVAGPLPRGASVLFVRDPFPKDEWMLTFIFRLRYRDPDLRVDRIATMRDYPDAGALAAYAGLFEFDGRTLTRLPHP